MTALDGPLPARGAPTSTVPRRTVVLGALAAVGASTLGPAGSASGGTRGGASTAYGAAAWRSLAGEVLPSAAGAVRLASITEQGDKRFETFQLRFLTMDGRPIAERLVVRHPRHGPVTFLLTTAGPAGTAVVNRRRS